VLLVCALVVTLFTYEAIRLELAEHWIWSDNLAKMQRAVQFEPGYAEYWDRVGRFVQFGLDEQDLVNAEQDYEKAVQISPMTARYWIDLAVAHENLGDLAKARHEFGIALQAYPDSAEVRWEYANFLLRQGQQTEALGEMRAAVQSDDTLLPLAINRAWRATRNANEMADAILPRTAVAYIEAIDFFGSEDNVDAGLLIWKRLADSHQPFEIEKLFGFFDATIRDGRGIDGKRMWLEALRACGLPHDPPADGSVVWNGGFEYDMLNGGYDWRLPPAMGVTADYDSIIFHGGKRSVRLDFGGGNNTDLAEPLEFVGVEPGKTYHFAGFLRTEGVTTESGVRFALFDPQRVDSVHAETEGLTGTVPWTELSTDIVAGPQTQVLQVELRRPPSRLFENKLGGTVWIDDVSLVGKAGGATSASASPERGAQ
jgi:hypothetical protein